MSSEVTSADEQQQHPLSSDLLSSSKALLKPPLTLDKLLDQYYIETSESLKKEALKWYRYGNISEVVAQIFGGGTPIFISLSAMPSRYRKFFTISAGISSTLAISANNFASYCHVESKERFKDLNSLLQKKGYEPLPLMSASLTTDTFSSKDYPSTLSHS